MKNTDLTNANSEKTITGEAIERWRYPRFFADNIHDTAVITGGDENHIRKVLRMRQGDIAVISDGDGFDYLSRLSDMKPGAVIFEVIEKRKNDAEPNIKLRLFQCLPKSDKLDFIVQKATELGACEITPVYSQRCVSRPDGKSAEKKRERYQKIAEEAAKQSGRSLIPHISPFMAYKNIFKENINDFLGIIFYENGGSHISDIISAKKADSNETFVEAGVSTPLPNGNPPLSLTFRGRGLAAGGTPVNIIIGSEGGFTEDEVLLAKNSGYFPATLGKRILRCETAPIAAISILMNLTGNI